MTDKVRELESKLKDLSAADEGGGHEDAEKHEDKPADKPDDDDSKKKKNDVEKKKLDVDLDGLLDELDAAQK